MLIGIMGKANVGKSTFFSAATELPVQSANYPFTTINANIGVGYARVKCVCREFGIQDNPIHSMCIDGNRYIPVKLIDVAGLVPGAHEGKGLGNKFLDDARQADAIIHVVDASGSTDAEGKPIPAGSGDPINDIDFVEKEFDLWIVSILNREWIKNAREFENQGGKMESMISKRLSGLSIRESHIADALNIASLRNKKPSHWDASDMISFATKLRQIAKPIVIAANKADVPTSEANIRKISQHRQDVIACASEAESLLRKASKKSILHYLPGDNSFDLKPNANLSEAQKRALDIVMAVMEKYGSTGVQGVIDRACFNLLKLIVVYPVEDELKLVDRKGNVLPDARLLPEGSTAKDLAITVHAELAKGFMYAIDARTKQRLGAEYRLKDGDVIKIVSATSRG